jgi:hypothetical protein
MRLSGRTTEPLRRFELTNLGLTLICCPVPQPDAWRHRLVEDDILLRVFSSWSSLKPDESEGCNPVCSGRTIRLFSYWPSDDPPTPLRSSVDTGAGDRDGAVACAYPRDCRGPLHCKSSGSQRCAGRQAAWYRSPTWRVLRALQSLLSAKQLQGKSAVTAPPFS